jgi:Flp pilus assembly protein TadG
MRLAICPLTHRHPMPWEPFMPRANRRPKRHSPQQGRRRGSLTVEMIMVVMVLLIVTVGIVQFGVFFADADEVALAARVGTEEASQLPGLPAAGPVPASIISAVEHQLLSSQIQWSHIRLEHNATPGNAVVVLNSDSGGGFDVNPKLNLAAPPFPGTHYVRLTVTVPLAEVFPRSLSFFGQQLFAPTGSYEHSDVFRYELTTP